MGLLMNTASEISDKVKEDFNDDKNYLFALKRNDFKRGLLKLFLSRLYYTMDGARSFVLYFNEKGIYEKEISNTVKGNFVLMPWDEINDFTVDYKSSKANITLVHLGAKLLYEVPFTGSMAKGNKERLDDLQKKAYNKLV